MVSAPILRSSSDPAQAWFDFLEVRPALVRVVEVKISMKSAGLANFAGVGVIFVS